MSAAQRDDRVPSVVIGIDIGGTGTRFVARSAGRVVGESVRSTVELAAGAIPERITRVLDDIALLVPAGHALAAVGIGATGPVDPATGEIDNVATLPGFSGIGLVRELTGRLARPVVIDNDAVAAALGEHAGAGARARRLLMITLGTGVGGALLLDGTPWRTASGTHPEIGHLPLFGNGPVGSGPPCYCGLTGCWEPRASRAALERDLAEGLGGRLASVEILPAAARRYADEGAVRAVFGAYGERVGRGIACLQAVYGPDLVVVGGGAARYFPLFEESLRGALSQDPDYALPARIVPAVLGERAGAIGAAVLAERALGAPADIDTGGGC